MPKRFIALVLTAVMTSQVITPVISYGGETESADLTVSSDDQVTSGSAVVIEEDTEITAESTEIISNSSSLPTSEIISADFSEDGTCGDNLTYTYDSDTYTLTISGTGDMTDYSSDEDYTNVSPWYSVSSQITSVIIEDGVTSIGNYAFYGCSNLTSITIPDTVTSIGSYVFVCNDSSLTSITIPNSVTSIGSYAFYYCTSLISVTMPDSMTSIGSGAFFYCNKLTSITIPDGVTSIGASTFRTCSKLTSITIPDGVTSIGDYAFSGCTGLKSITIPDSVTSMGTRIFYNCSSLTKAAIPDGVTKISSYTFYKCSSLTSVTIPDDITSIGGYAFYDCSKLTSIDVPDSVTDIGIYAFDGCSALTSIIIPESVTAINKGAFKNCSALTSITIPSGVTTIDAEAFYGCSSAESITIPEGVTSIGEAVFVSCKSLTSIYLPDSITSIGNTAFVGCTGLTSIIIPYGVTTIGDWTFSQCTGLTSIYIPDSVTSIGESTFQECTSLTSIDIPNSVTSIGEMAFGECTSLTSIIIPNSITTISAWTFYSCTSLTSITIPDSVTSIESYAFSYCPYIVFYVFLGSYAEEYAIENGISYNIIVYSITINISDENGEKISSDLYSINWYEDDGDEAVAEGSTLSGIKNGSIYEYEIILDSSIGKTYYQPDRTEVTAADEDITIDIQLELISTIIASGKVTDSSGKAVSGAEVTFIQTINGFYTEYVYTTSQEDGKYSAEILNVPTIVSISYDNYYTSKKSVITSRTDSEDVEIDTISLSELPSDRVTLTLQKTYAAAEGDEAYTSYVLSFNSLSFTVYNETQNKNVTGFTAQYPYLVFNDGAVSAGNTLTISVNDTIGETTCPDVSVVLDDSCCGEADLELIENGKIYLSDISGNDETTVIIFDENGDLVKSYSAGTSLTTDPLTAGNYQLALITKTTLFKNVSNISKLSEMGLSAGTDYTAVSAGVSNGVITEISDVSVPILDETKLYYTVSDNTTLYTSSNSVVAGRYFSVSVKYEIDSKYSSSNEKVEVEIPEGLTVISGSLVLDGIKSTYTYSGNVVSVSANGSSGVVRFYAAGLSEGTYDINGYLNFYNGSDSVTQPIGSATVAVSGVEINVQSKSASTNVIVSGTALAGSTITIYDNYEAVGTTTANSNGNWSVNIDLYKPYSFSYHLIYAEIENSGYNITVTTDEEYLVYNKNYVQLSKITMYNTAHPATYLDIVDYETEFDFLHASTTIPSYRYWDLFPTFTFKVEFDGDASKASNVYVITTDSYGEDTYVECEYISREDAWIGTYDYTSYEYAPVAVTAAYSNAESIPITISSEMYDYGEEYLESLVEEFEELEAVGDITQTVISDSISEETGLGEKLVYYSVLDEDSGEYTDVYSYTNISELSSNDDIDYSAMPLLEDENGNKYYLNYGYYNEAEAITLYDVTNNIKIIIAGSGNISDILAISNESDVVTNFDLGSSLAGNISTLANCLGIALGIVGTVISGMVLFEVAAISTPIVVGVTICAVLTGLVGLSATVVRGNEIREKLDSHKGEDCYKELSEYFDFYYNVSTQESIIGIIMSSILTGENGLWGIGIGKYGFKTGSGVGLNFAATGISLVSLICGWQLEKINDEIDEKCGDTGNGDGWSGDTGSGSTGSSGTGTSSTGSNGTEPKPSNPYQKANKIFDPSGYVYEAVPSNRVNGVTTTIYYSNEVLDDYGLSTGTMTSTLWDAGDYDQVNPLTTDANGEYGWDVPEGSWQVKYEKSGYTTAYSEWLPVPPPQFDVNQALVATTAPSVESVNVYEDEIQVIFSKYMKLSTADTITVTIDGEEVEGTVAASNAEYNGDETEEYASIFIFTPNENISGEATVTIASAEGYNGLMTSAYSVTKTAVVRPRYINSADSITVKYNSGALLEVEILPNEAAEGLVLEASTASDVIATVTNETITLDSSGTANIMLNGELMGQTVLTLSIQGTDITKTVTVNVSTNVDESSKCAKVTASIASGSTVEYGTELVLSTETDRAEIYYTLDGTCPCTIGSESRLLYTEPLVLTEDTFIIAYAVKDGYDDSNTAGFIYTIADSGDDTTEESTESSTETTSESTTESTTETTETLTEATSESTTKTTETSTETTTADFETSTTTVTESTTETTTKATSSSSSSGGGGGGSSSTCTIKLVPNNGVNSSTKYVKKNSTLAEPDTPVYDGYTFTGWYTDSDCTTLYDFSVKVTSSFTLYGGWKEADEDEAEDDEIETAKEETQVDIEKSVLERIVKVVIGSTVVTVETDGQESTYTMDTAPYIQSESSSTLVPLRFVAVAVCGDEVDDADGSDIVDWDSAAKTASISVGDDIISFTAGSEYMSVNGKDVLMSNGVKAEITDGRMFIPFRALGEALGVEVDWDSTTKTAVYTAG